MTNIITQYLKITSIIDLPLIWYALTLAILAMFFALASIDIGMCITYRYISKSELTRLTLLKTINPIWASSQGLLIAFLLVSFLAFEKACIHICFIFKAIIITLISAILLRSLAFKIRLLAKTKRSINRMLDYVISDTSLVTLICIASLLGSLFQGTQFYSTNEGTIVSFFTLESLFTNTNVLFQLILITLSIMQGCLFCYLSVPLRKLRWIAFYCGIIFLVIWCIVMVALQNNNSAWCNSYFDTRILHYLVLAVGALVLTMLTKRKMKLALLLNTTCIALLTVLFAAIMFPYILPSSADISQSMMISNSYS